VRVALKQYGLPKINELMNNVPSKQEWKRTVNDATNKHCEGEWKKDKQEKSSMLYMDIKSKPIGKKAKYGNVFQTIY